MQKKFSKVLDFYSELIYHLLKMLLKTATRTTTERGEESDAGKYASGKNYRERLYR
jgi:hypothetical protein